MATIQIRRGSQAAVTGMALAAGELALALDTGNVYIGTAADKVHLNPAAGMTSEAVKLKTSRDFALSGDAIAAAVGFDGTQSVTLQVALATMAGLTPGTYTKLTADAKGRVTAGTTLAVTDLPPIPASKVTGLPAKITDLPNDAGYQTAAQVSAAVAALVASSPAALDTPRELAAALGNDPNFAATIAGQIGGKVDKITGKGLSEADFTAAEKAKLSGLSNYTLPAATASGLGGVKIGEGLAIAGGVVRVDNVDCGTF